MVKQLESTLDTFSRREIQTPWFAIQAVGLLALFCLVAATAAAKNWLFFGLSLTAFAAAAAFAIRSFMSVRRAEARLGQKRLDWATAVPELQRQNLNVEVLELSRVLDVGSDQITDLQSAYIIAEDLALRQIQLDEGTPLLRHVTLSKTPFDAVMVKNDVVNCIDVTFLVTPDIRQEKIDASIRKITGVKKAFAERQAKTRVRLVLVLVTQLTAEDDEKLRLALNKNRFEDSPADVDIRLLDFESLQLVFMTE